MEGWVLNHEGVDSISIQGAYEFFQRDLREVQESEFLMNSSIFWVSFLA